MKTTIKNKFNLLKKTLLLSLLFPYTSICFSQLPTYNLEGSSYENKVIKIGDDISCDPYDNLDGNIVIGKNVYVIVFADMELPAGATITIKPGGFLCVIMGVKITSISNGLEDRWGGIIVQGNTSSPDQEDDMKFICQYPIPTRLGSANQDDLLIDDLHFFSTTDNLKNGVLILGGSSLDDIGVLGGGKINNAETAVTVEPGGLVYCIRSEINNSSFSAISFVGYPTGRFIERSVIKNNEFTTAFTNLTEHEVKNLMYAENRIFHFPIQGNYFTHYTTASEPNVSTKIGVNLLNSVADIHGNQFFGFLIGLNNNSFSHKAWVNKITENSFYSNYVSIWGNALDNLILKKNFISVAEFDQAKYDKLYTPYNPSFPTNYGGYSTGLIEQDIAQVYVHQNQMSEANSNSTFNLGACQVQTRSVSGTNTYFQNSSYYKNTFSKTSLNLYSYNVVNGNSNLKNNSQFSCNQFYSQITGGPLNKTNFDLYTSGIYLIAQGNNQSSSGNIFSSPEPIDKQFYFSRMLSDPDATYFYDNQPNRNPTSVNVIKNLTTNVNACPAPTEYYELLKPECDAPYINPIDGGISAGMTILKGNLGTYRTNILDMELGGIDSSNQDDYDYARHMYNNDLLQLLTMYDDAMDVDSNGTIGINAYYDSITYLLKNHITPYGAYHLLGMSLEQGNYNEARDYADSMISWYPQFDTGMHQLKDYIELLAEYAETVDSAKFIWLQDNFNTIKTIADDSSHISSSKAKVWVQYITDIDTSNGYHGYVMYPLDIPRPEIEEDSAEEPEFAVTIYPNPFEDEGIHVQIENLSDHTLNYDIKIYDFNGNQIDEKPLSIDASNMETADFDTDGISPGFYFVRIFEDNSEIHYALIYK